MKDEHRIEALRFRVVEERRQAGKNRVRFSAGLKQAVADLASTADSRNQLSIELGLGSTTLDTWVRRLQVEKGAAVESPPPSTRNTTQARLKEVAVIADASTERGTHLLTLRFPSGASLALTVEELRALLGGTP